MRMYTIPSELYHHGIKGMKWGVRRYRNKDGSLTPAGKKRFVDPDESNRVFVDPETRRVRDLKRRLGETRNTNAKKRRMSDKDQKKYDSLVRSLKGLGKGNADEEALLRKELETLKNTDLKKYAKENWLDDYEPQRIKELYDSDIKDLKRQINWAKKFVGKDVDLNQRLDRIDTSSLSYRKAKKLANKVYDDWLRENIYKNKE